MDSQQHGSHTSSLPPATRVPSRRSRIVGVLIALIAMAALGWLAWYLTHREAPAPGRSGGGGGRGGPPGTTVGVATASRADLPVFLDALGTVTAAGNVTVRPQVSGVLQKILFQEGQMVKAGQVLAMIDPRQFEMAVMQAAGQRQRDEAQLDAARIQLQRFRTLLEQDSIARQEVDTQAALVKQLEGTVMTDKAAEGTARINLGYTKVVAPISGRLGLRVVDVGNVVGPNDTNGIAVITQLSPIDVEFSIPQDQVSNVQRRAAGDTALPAAALDRTRSTELDSGRFSALDNQVDTQTGTVRAKARFQNAGLALFPSQFVNVRLMLQTIKGAVVVPVTALRHGTNGDYVYVLDAEKKTVAMRTVQRGQATVDKVEIVSGLQAGEQVITEGADRLKDGAKVTLPGDAPRGAGNTNGNANGNGRRRSGAADAASTRTDGAASATPAPSEGQRRRRSAEGAAQ